MRNKQYILIDVSIKPLPGLTAIDRCDNVKSVMCTVGALCLKQEYIVWAGVKTRFGQELWEGLCEHYTKGVRDKEKGEAVGRAKPGQSHEPLARLAGQFGRNK